MSKIAVKAMYLRSILLAVVLAGGLLVFVQPAQAQTEPLPDLTVEKTGPSTAEPDSNGSIRIDYTVTVRNIGTGGATVQPNVLLLTDTVSARNNFINGTMPGSGNQGYCANGTGGRGGASFVYPRCPQYPPDVILAGETRVFNPAIYIASPKRSGTVTNCATVDPDNAIAESDESNNTACVTTVIGRRSH